MRKKPKLIFAGVILTSALFAQGIVTGCSGNRELLEKPLPQSYLLPNPPNKVWEAVLSEVSKFNRRILARDDAAHLISWVNEVQPNATLHASLTDPRITSRRHKAIAIAVIRVESAPGGSKLTIRLTYCSSKAFFGVSSSRGNYEQEIFQSIKISLISEDASHDKS